MDNPRLFLLIALSFVGLLLFQAWQKDYGTKPQERPAAEAARDVPASPAASAPEPAPDVPAAPASAEAPDRPSAPGTALSSGEKVQVRTDVLQVEIDTYGGDVRNVLLLDYPVSIDDETPTALLQEQGPNLHVAQSGFSMSKGAGPDHHAVYEVAKTDYRLAEGEDAVRVELTWRDGGVEIIKRFIFPRGSYAVQVQYEVRNNSDAPWSGAFYRQLKRTSGGDSGPQLFGIYTYTGGAIYTPAERYEKIDFSDMREDPLQRQRVEGGWVAMLQHYFLSAWVPGGDSVNTFYSRYQSASGYYNLGLISPLQEVAPGDQAQFESVLYVGPKIQDRLEELAPGLELTVDYGILTFLSKPLFWLLEALHSLVGNWGWAIVLLVVLLKIAFYKLSETSYRSMAKMRAVQPRMQQLKERYGDDKQKMNQALMELYKKEKINPLGGCLPILVQIPVFIALYWVLLESVELRQAPWILWIEDLSIKDPWFVLPILMGLTMVVQQRLNPAPLDPLQAKIMMFLPVVFTVFFLFFPAGLVLYWVTNNALSILQQWVITRRVTGAAAKG